MKKNRIPQAQFILWSHLNKEHVVHTHVDTEKRLEGKVKRTYFRKAGLWMFFICLLPYPYFLTFLLWECLLL